MKIILLLICGVLVLVISYGWVFRWSDINYLIKSVVHSRNTVWRGYFLGYNLELDHFGGLDDNIQELDSHVEFLQSKSTKKYVLAGCFFVTHIVLLMTAILTVLHYFDPFDIVFGGIVFGIVVTGTLFYWFEYIKSIAIDRAYLVLRQTEENLILRDEKISAEEKIRKIIGKRNCRAYWVE